MTQMTEQQVHTLAEYPELTPEGMGRRFLKYLDALTSREQLTPEFLEQQMGVKLSDEAWGGGFIMELPDSRRSYSVAFYRSVEVLPQRSAELRFSTAANDGQEADMFPVCGMDFDAYRIELERMGYVDTQMADYDHWGRLPHYYYERGDIYLIITVRGQSVENPRRLCISSIDVRFGG